MDTFAYEKEKWDAIETVGDFLNFIEDPDADVIGWMSYNVDLSKAGFWNAAQVNFDFDIESMIEKEPEILSTEISSKNRVPSEFIHHEKYGYKSGYDRHNINEDLEKIINVLGFEDGYHATINNQPPATLMNRHTDFISCFTYENLGKDKSIEDMPYDKDKRHPAGMKSIWRCFVALADWKPGQLINFEPDFWTGWKKGDVVFFDWKNTPHSTANCGIHNRPILKITGTIKDDSYVLETRNTGLPIQLSVN